MRITAEHRDLK